MWLLSESVLLVDVPAAVSGQHEGLCRTVGHTHRRRDARRIHKLLLLCCRGMLAVGIAPQADGSPVGIPPSLYDVSPQAQQLVQLVAAVQAETFTYAR